MRQNRRIAQLGQAPDLGRPSFVAFDAGVSVGLLVIAAANSVTCSDATGSVRFRTVMAVPFAPDPGFRLIIENMPYGSTAHEVLVVVFQVRGLGSGPKTQKPQLNVLLWQRARDPQKGAWSLPGGRLRH